jgi:HK97 gp10 family phage protein
MAGKSFQLTGAQDLQKVLEEVPKKYKKKALKSAFREGAKLIKKDAQDNARQHGIDSDYWKDITVSVPKGRVKLDKSVVMTVAVKKEHSPLAHLFEYGTAQRFTNEGEARGRIDAMPHLRPALDNKSDEAIQTIAEVTRKNLELIARDLTRGQKVKLTQKARRQIR